LEDGFAHMGYTYTGTIIYGLTKDEINEIANIASYASNEYSFADELADDNPERISMGSSLSLVNNGNDEYFPIEASAGGISYGVKTHLDTQFYFSERSNSYEISDEYKKLFEF